MVKSISGRTVLVWSLPAVTLPDRPDPAKREALWRDLVSTDAAVAYRAVLALAADPEGVVPLVRARFKPRPPADPERVARLVAALDSDSFADREQASQELAELGPAAEDALRQALAGKASPEVRHRVEGLLGKLRKEGPPAEHLRCVRALEVLERVGTPAAVDLLRQLARGPLEPAVAKEVRASLGRLEERAP